MNKIVEANCETGEVIEREMTVEEKSLYDSMIADNIMFEQTMLKQQADKESALMKLQALGLTKEEINTLIS